MHLLLAPLFVGAMVYFRHSREALIQLLFLAAIFYVIIALLHHHKDKSLTLEVMIEYILIAWLALILSSGILF